MAVTDNLILTVAEILENLRGAPVSTAEARKGAERLDKIANPGVDVDAAEPGPVAAAKRGTKAHGRKSTKWSSQDDRNLRAGRAAGMTYGEIAAHLKRTESATRQRAITLGLTAKLADAANGAPDSPVDPAPAAPAVSSGAPEGWVPFSGS